MIIYPSLAAFQATHFDSRKWSNAALAIEKSFTMPQSFARSIESTITYWCEKLPLQDQPNFQNSLMYQSLFCAIAGQMRLEIADACDLAPLSAYDDTTDTQYYTAVPEIAAAATAQKITRTQNLPAKTMDKKITEITLRPGEILVLDSGQAWRIFAGAGTFLRLRVRNNSDRNRKWLGGSNAEK